jgi:membrane protein
MDIGAQWKRVEQRVDRARQRFAWLDHVIAMLAHYGRVNGNGQAGAVTYFAFLAFFPIMALIFFAVGIIANVFPHARDNLVEVINSLFQGLVGEGKGEVSLSVFQENAGKAGLFGLIGFLYAGLGWMSAMRSALQTLFSKPPKDNPNLFIGKARDLMTLGAVGLLLLVAFGVTSAVNSYDGKIIEGIGLDPHARFASLGVKVLGGLLAVVLITTLLTLLYQFLARPHVSHRALREGAILAAVGFVLLKLLADRLIALTHGQPAFTVFGFSLVLLVLINYFSRVVMYGAAWAYTSKREPDLFEDEQPGPHWRPPPSS